MSENEEIREEQTEEEQTEETLTEEETAEAGEETETEEVSEAEADEGDDLAEALEAEKDRFLRLAAEFDNFRKRTAKEKIEAYGEATARCIEQLLPVVDNFERAVDAPCSDEQYHSGMVMILEQLRTFLEKTGVTEVEALGAEFDPNVHQAIKRSEATDEYPENTVCEVFQKGYKLKDRLIRPAMVTVSG